MRVAVAEDDFLIAMQMEDALSAAGLRVVGLARTADEVIDLVRTMVNKVSVPLHEAVAMATDTPARAITLSTAMPRRLMSCASAKEKSASSR